jgi:hypothetical protein
MTQGYVMSLEPGGWAAMHDALFVRADPRRAPAVRIPVAPEWRVRVRVGEDPGDEYGAPLTWAEYVHGCDGVDAEAMERAAFLPLSGELVLGGGAAPVVSVVRVA